MEAAALPRIEPARPALSPRLWRLTTDHQLVEMIRMGQDGAFEALYDRHHRPILSFCRHMLSDPHEAEDAVQHTFLAAYRELSYTTKDITVRPWLFTIARNRCYSMLRSRREQPTDEFDQIVTEGFAAEVQQREDLRHLLTDMSKLPDEQRAALVMSELEALTHAEIGDILGVRTDKVKALVFQARSSLVASKTARETPCAEIRMELVEGRGAALRRANLRRHLRECDGCREFRTQVEGQRRGIRLLLPVVPSLALKELIVGAAVVGGGTAAVGGGAVLSGAVKGGALKGIFALLAVSAGTAGTAIVVSAGDLPIGGAFADHHAMRIGPLATGHSSRHVTTGHSTPVTRAHTAAVHTATGQVTASDLGSLGQYALASPTVAVIHGKVRTVQSSAKQTAVSTSLPPLAPTPAGTSLPPLAPGTASAAAGPTVAASASTPVTATGVTAPGVTPVAPASAPVSAASSPAAAPAAAPASGTSGATAASGSSSASTGATATGTAGSTPGTAGSTATGTAGSTGSAGSTGTSGSTGSPGFGSRSAGATGTTTTTSTTTTTPGTTTTPVTTTPGTPVTPVTSTTPVTATATSTPVTTPASVITTPVTTTTPVTSTPPAVIPTTGPAATTASPAGAAVTTAATLPVTPATVTSTIVFIAHSIAAASTVGH